MPANLPAEAKAKWLKVMEAKSPEEKLKALEEFLSTVPKHKGTEKLIKQVRRQMAILRREIEKRKIKKSKGPTIFIKKSGDAQIAMIGFANCGKLKILSTLTNVRITNINDYTISRKPIVGSFNYNGVTFQIIDLPPFYPGISEVSGLGTQFIAMIRNADAIMLVVDLTYDPLYQVNVIEKELSKSGILIKKPNVLVSIERRGEGGIVVFGKLKNCTVDDVRKLLNSYKIYHAYVRIEGEATLDDIEESLWRTKIYKPTIIIATNLHEDNSGKLKLLYEAYSQDFRIVLFKESEYVTFRKKVGSSLMELLGLIRVYTRDLSGKIAEKPLVVKKGTTIGEAAKLIHSKLFENFKYAKVWSKYSKVNPLRVGKDYVLHDGDVIQIVT